MAFRYVIAACLVAAAAAEKAHPAPVYAPQPAYGYQPEPTYGYQPEPAYGYQQHQPSYGHTYCPTYPEAPACSQNTTDPWCLEDAEYPEYEIKHAIAYHKHKVLELYADVADLSTENSVDRLTQLEEETYLCPAEVGYVRPLRAINTDGKWRVIVNNIKVDYETLTQTTRVEKCLTSGEACPLVPHCYGSKCLQKSIYHRFLIYDPCDSYFPFAIETVQLPSACACLLDEYVITH